MPRPSSRHPEHLPSPDALERLCQSLAILDAILSPDWESRYYSFNKRWDEDANHRMASMRNGSGDEYFIVFQPEGAILKGFAHESAAANQILPVFEGVPPSFTGFLRESAFSIDDTTFCLWNTGQGWCRAAVNLPRGKDPDGSENLLAILGGDPADYVEFAEAYYETSVPIAAVRKVYAHEPLDDASVASLNPDVDLAELEDDIDEIGFPSER